jgi:hypothetical protein
MRWWQVLLTSVLPGLVSLGGVLATHGWEKIANGVVFLAFAVLGVRTARLGIFAWPDHVVVRDYFRTYQIRWSEISSFEVPPPYGTWRNSGLRIRLVDGRLISASLYARNPFDTARRRTEDVVQELNQLLKQNSVG